MAQNYDPFASPELGAFVGGAIPSPHDPRDFLLPKLGRRPATARTNHDLRNYKGQSLMVPIGDQGQVGSCTGWAWARLRAAATAKYHIDIGQTPDLGDTLSARFLYHLERSEMMQPPTWPQDSGADMRAGGKVLDKYGAAPERYCPYNGQADDGAITQEMLDAAAFYGVSAYYRLTGSGAGLIDSILQCLDEGWPCVAAILVPPSFEQVGANGRVPTPGRGEQVLGGHAITICGNYIDSSADGGLYLVGANQWSAAWGDHGYFYLPASYATTQAGQYGPWLQEAWTIR